MCKTVPTVVAVLARVTADLNQPRGADVLFGVDVPEAWLREGVRLEIDLPRLLSCQRCEGGGCDLCERKGAFSRHQTDCGEEPLRVQLPASAGADVSPVMLRLPGLGARSLGDEPLPAGHLLLTVRPIAPSEERPVSPRVRRLRGPGDSRPLWRSLLSPAGLLAVGTIGFLILWWILK